MKRDLHKFTKKFKKILIQIISEIKKTPESLPFKFPIDFKKLEIYDYQIIITKMMDLETLAKNIKKNKYLFIEQALDDFQLIWDNCYVYNSEESSIKFMADFLSKKMRKLIKYYFKQNFVYGKNNDSYEILQKRKIDGYFKKLFFKKNLWER